MKTFLTSAAIFVATTFSAFALDITYPKDACAVIKGSDFSAPAADSSFYLFELHCEDASGKNSVFITSWADASSFFGFSRVGAPEKINLIPGNVGALEVRD